MGFTGLDLLSCTGGKPKRFSICSICQYTSVFCNI